MKLIKMLQTSLKVSLLFISITAIFSLPGLVRCAGEVNPEGKSEYSSINDDDSIMVMKQTNFE